MANAQKFIANGGTIGQYVDQMIKDIQAKPEYKSIIASKTAQKTTVERIGTDANGNPVYGSVTGSTVTPITGA